MKVPMSLQVAARWHTRQPTQQELCDKSEEVYFSFFTFMSIAANVRYCTLTKMLLQGGELTAWLFAVDRT
jgi:hypothetical protein